MKLAHNLAALYQLNMMTSTIRHKLKTFLKIVGQAYTSVIQTLKLS